MNDRGGLVSAVARGSLGERLGLRPGDRLLAVNGHAVRDIVDVRFYGADEALSLAVWRSGEELGLHGRRSYGEELGLDFVEPLFDGVRTCRNRCPFCFVAGLPPGLRPSLYVRDDDYRLSFLSGSFVTLTNLTDDDWQRLAEQRLSPLHVSVQATAPDLRRRLLGGRPIPDIREQIRRLGSIGIRVEAQVVVCPGLNDGAALERTVSELWGLREPVGSVALVPVGLTRYQPARLRPLTSELARELLSFAEEWRRRAWRESGRHFVHASDELYLLAGRTVPAARSYDGYPQLANGVGPVRRFLDDWERTRRRLSGRGAPRPTVRSVTLVTGQAFAPYVERLAQDLTGVLRVPCAARAVVNRFLGERVTVAGLLSGQDVAAQLAGADLGELVILPRGMFDAAGERTLDDWTRARMASALGRPIALAGTPREVVAAVTAERCERGQQPALARGLIAPSGLPKGARSGGKEEPACAISCRPASA